ncbi:MAG: condensation domain-containing protein [Chitinophagaceae bacterium]
MSLTTFQSALLNAFNMYAEDVAIEKGSQAITFRQFGDAAMQTAGLLLPSSTPAAKRYVGVIAEDRVSMIFGITGVSLAGEIFVPLSHHLPLQRIMSMISVAGISVILHQGCTEFVDGLNNALASVGTVTFIDMQSPVTDLMDTALLPVTNTADELYVYFTSGSSGIPKAVLGVNGSLMNFLQWEQKQMKFAAKTRFSQLVHTGFDAFLRDVFIPVFAGATIVIPEDSDNIFEASTLQQWIRQNRINYIHCVPGVFRLFNTAVGHAPFPDLKGVFLSGEKVLPGDLEKWFTIAPPEAALYNFYGTTETTLISTYRLLTKDDLSLERLPAGKPIDHTAVYVLDENGLVCAANTEGHVVIASPFTSKGYLENGIIRDAHFKADTVQSMPEYRMYYTGDRGRISTDGDLLVLHRNDAQLKINGIRIEPGDIESRISQFPGIRESAVFKNGTERKEFLAGVLVLEDEADRVVAASDLADFLALYFPLNLIPSTWLRVPALPRLANGKLDRGALQRLAQPEAVATDDQHLSPDEVEADIYRIWSEITRNKTFSIRSTFFEMGGNSFHLIALVAKIHSLYGIRLSIKDIFQNNTVAKLSAFIKSRTTGAGFQIGKAEPKPVYPLASGQFQVYHQQVLYPDSVTYNLPQFFVIESAVDAAAMKESLKKLVQRHAALRTGFTVKDGSPCQFISTSDEFDFSYQEIPALSSAGITQSMESFVKPFDLHKPPLFRASLVKIEEKKFLLMMDVHHIVADGYSQLILNRDLWSLYTGNMLPELLLEYVDFAEWQQKYTKSNGHCEQLDYWIRKLTPLPRQVFLPVNQLSMDKGNMEAGSFNLTIDAATTSQIKDFIRQKETTLYSFLMAVYNVLLSKLSMQEDIVVGSAVDGRVSADLNNLVGMFVNTIAIRNKVDVTSTFDQFVRQVSQTLIEALDNKNVAFEEVVNKLNVPHRTRNRLFNVMFVFLNMEVTGSGYSDIVKAVPFRAQSAKFDMILTGYEMDAAIKIKIEYSAEMFFHEQIMKISSYLQEIIQQVLHDPAVSIADITLKHNIEAVGYELKDVEFTF